MKIKDLALLVKWGFGFWWTMGRKKGFSFSLLKLLLSSMQFTNVACVTVTCRALWPDARFGFINWPPTVDGKRLYWPTWWQTESFLLLCGSQLYFTKSNSKCDYAWGIILCWKMREEEKKQLLLSLKRVKALWGRLIINWGADGKQPFMLFCQHSVIKGGSSTSRKQIQDKKGSQIIMDSTASNMPRMVFCSNKAFYWIHPSRCGEKGSKVFQVFGIQKILKVQQSGHCLGKCGSFRVGMGKSTVVVVGGGEGVLSFC